jgi:glycopeptide antibiotics resistance protein
MDIGINDLTFDVSPIIFLGMAIFLFVVWRQKRKFSYVLCLFIFLAYLFLAIRETLFPIYIQASYIEARKHLPLLTGVNLIPFYFGRSQNIDGIILGIFQNILLTMPFGFGLSFVLPTRIKNIIWLVVVGGGLGFEMAQLLICLAIGYTYRVIDVNDILCNSIGALIGYAFFRFFSWIYLSITQRFKIKHEGVLAYIQDVASQA